MKINKLSILKHLWGLCNYSLRAQEEAWEHSYCEVIGLYHFQLKLVRSKETVLRWRALLAVLLRIHHLTFWHRMDMRSDQIPSERLM